MSNPHEARLEHLLASWSLRARPGAPGQQTELVAQNIAALEHVLASARNSRTIAETVRASLERLDHDLKQKARVGGHVSRRQLTAYARRVEKSILALKDIA